MEIIYGSLQTGNYNEKKKISIREMRWKVICIRTNQNPRYKFDQHSDLPLCAIFHARCRILNKLFSTFDVSHTKEGNMSEDQSKKVCCGTSISHWHVRKSLWRRTSWKFSSKLQGSGFWTSFSHFSPTLIDLRVEILERETYFQTGASVWFPWLE